MASFNKVILMGNIVEDIDLKQTPSGVAVTSFRIAVNRKFKNKDGETETDFIQIVAWRQTAEWIKRYLAKGSCILVCGALQSRSWTDKDGNKRSTLEVVADEATFGEKKANNDTNNNAPYSDNLEDNFELMSADEDCPF